MWRRITSPYPITREGPVAYLMQHLRSFPRSVQDGCAALRDLLLWGSVYPRAVDLKTLAAMRKRP